MSDASPEGPIFACPISTGLAKKPGFDNQEDGFYRPRSLGRNFSLAKNSLF
jgi:hypothetical protein